MLPTLPSVEVPKTEDYIEALNNITMVMMDQSRKREKLAEDEAKFQLSVWEQLAKERRAIEEEAAKEVFETRTKYTKEEANRYLDAFKVSNEQQKTKALKAAEDEAKSKLKLSAKYRALERKAKKGDAAAAATLAGMQQDAIEKAQNRVKKKYEAAATKEAARVKRKTVKDEAKFAEKEAKKRDKLEAKKTKQNADKKVKEASGKLTEGLLGAGKSPQERLAAIKQARADAKKINEQESLATGQHVVGAGAGMLINAISDLSKQLENKIDTIAGYKSSVDTYMQGSKHAQSGGSY